MLLAKMLLLGLVKIGHVMDANFSGVIAFGFLASMLLLGVVLRAQVGFFRRMMIPASLLGGLVGFVLISTGWGLGYGPEEFKLFTLHFFTLSFMSLCLQALLGIGVSDLLGFVGEDMSPYQGAIVANGFTQGPGQALAYGSIWEQNFGLPDIVSVGLIFASLGFAVSFLVGVPLARWVASQRITAGHVPEVPEADVLSGILQTEHREALGQSITHPANVDTLAYHIGLLGLAYVLTYAYIEFMLSVTAGVMLGDMPLATFFSYNLFFFHGLVVATVLRLLVRRLGLAGYFDTGTQKMITGAAVDFMIVGTLMSIQITVLAAYLLPILAVASVVSIATLVLCFYYGRRSQSEFGLLRALTLFGCCTGSAGTGLLLLRIVDPKFSTPVARELALFNILITLLGIHLLMGVIPILPQIGVVYGSLVFAVTLGIGFVAMRFVRA
ncbi:MAG: ESS family glutamate:Na+ symporter [Parvibaculaceae bacterium]|jgi:ESS family glutamate:Na+ symporter